MGQQSRQMFSNLGGSKSQTRKLTIGGGVCRCWWKRRRAKLVN